jgi:hypothetical protein
MKRDLCFTGELISDLTSSFVLFELSVVCNTNDDDDDEEEEVDDDDDITRGGC